MVNFAEELQDGRVGEWRDYYVNYSRLKGWIEECEKSMSPEAAQNFFDELTLSIERVDSFYNKKEEDLVERMNEEFAKPNPDESSIEQDLKKLESFARVNREALRKISKKFDKNCLPGSGTQRTDMGRNTFGATSNWGSATEPLQDRVISRFSNYNFGLSTDRLEKLRVGLQERKGTGAKKPMKMADLEVPLLDDTPKRQSSGIEFNDELQRGLLASVKAKWRMRYLPSAVWFGVVSLAVLFCWFKNTHGGAITEAADLPGGLNGGSYVVIWVTIITLTLLVWQWPSDHVMLTATLVLNIFGLLNATEAWGAFSNSVVLSVAALSVVGDVVSHTGIIDILFAKLLGDTTNLYVAMLKIWIPCAIGAASISNTAVMACCMPAVEDWCNKTGYHVALFFMPISYLMLVAGTFAVFSTSTNLVAQAQLVAHDLPPLETFELGVPACLNMTVSLFYLMFATPIFLNRFMKDKNNTDGDDEKSTEDAKSLKGQRSFFVRVRVQLRLQQSKTIKESGLLECLDADSVDAVERHGSIQERPPADFALQFDDILSMRVTANGLERLRAQPGFMLLSQDGEELYATMHQDARELAEVILDEGCPLAKHRLCKAKTFKSYAGAIIAVRFGTQSKGRNLAEGGRPRADSGSENPPRSPKPYANGSSASPGVQWLDGSEWLSHGDQLVLDVPSGFCDQYRDSSHFVMLRKLVNRTSSKDNFKAYLSGGILMIMLVCVALSLLDLFVCALGAIVLLVVSKCATPDSVKKAVRLNVVLTIVGAFGLGNAIGKHGIAQALANLLVFIFAPFGHTGLLTAIWIVVVLLGIIFHGTAVVALMFPLCVHVAQASGIPLHQMIAVLCYSVACQMLSPVSYNTNLMAYAACPDYTFGDFTKVGFPLVVILFILSIPTSEYWWPDGGPVV